jgi:hypothetical protein
LSHPPTSVSKEADLEGGDMLIDCSKCEMYRSEHCEDCLVSVLLHPPEDEVEIADEMDPPLRALSDAGLIPVLKFRARPEPPNEARTG